MAAARQAILAPLTAIAGRERVSIRDALTRVLAEPVIAPCNVPAHDNAAMDGYAIRHVDLAPAGTTRLQVVGTAFAGRPFSGRIGAGQAVRIMTGAEIPQGADTIVIQEHARAEGASAIIPANQEPLQNVRRAGEDVAQGSIALPSGKRCGAAEIGLIASLGIPEVSVVRRLRVAFFSTGDEIATIGQRLGPGQVYDSNRYTLFSALTLLGCELLDMGVIEDNPTALEQAFIDASANADAILTSGGVSVGEADFIRALMARLGDVAFWKIDIKPGRPMAFGRIGNAWIFGLPGNPVAVMVTFYQFVKDALLTLSGVSPLPERVLFDATITSSVAKRPGRCEFLRGHLVPARPPRPCRRRAHGERGRCPGFGCPQIDVRRQLFHRSPRRSGQRGRGRHRTRSTIRRSFLTANTCRKQHTMTQDELKQAAAHAALEYVEEGSIVGVGTGSTVNHFIDGLAAIKDRIAGAVSSSEASSRRLAAHGIVALFDLNDITDLPIYVDGADEIDGGLSMIKGGGCALTREKSRARRSSLRSPPASSASATPPSASIRSGPFHCRWRSSRWHAPMSSARFTQWAASRSCAKVS